MAKFIRTDPARYKAGSPIKAADEGIPVLNGEMLYERPRCLYLGPTPRIVRSVYPNWPSKYYRGWSWIDGIGYDLDWGSFMISRPKTRITASILLIGVHNVEDFVPTSPQQLQDSRGLVTYDITTTFKQMVDGSSSWGNVANPSISTTLSAGIVLWPSIKSGLSRFLLQARHMRFSPKGNDGFVYREGQLFGSDFALIQTLRIVTDLPSSFDPSKPIRFDLEAVMQTATLQGDASLGSLTPSDITLYCVGSTLTGQGVLS